MKTFTLFILMAAGCFSALAQYNTINLTVSPDESSVIPLTYKNLRLVPVHANDIFLLSHQGLGNYTNLKDAIEGGKIVISEMPSGETVNTLFAENVSRDTLFLMAGEIVQGGKQDRMIAKNFLIAPGEKVDLSAFCVE